MRFSLIPKRFIKVIGLCVCVMALIFAVPASISAQVPFGGTVVSVFTCVNGLWIIMGGTGIPGSYMYIYGASVSPFLSVPLSHVGQNAVGFASAPAPCLVPCFVGLCPIGFGLTILPLHGTSI